MSNLPTYIDLLKENAHLKLEIAEAMELLRPASLVNGQGREVVSSLVDHARYMRMIYDTEMEHMKEVEKRLDELEGGDVLEKDSRQLDLFENESEVKCPTCWNVMTLVRPGKHQCDYCESMKECHHYGLCVQNNYPTFGEAGCCKICPLKKE